MAHSTSFTATGSAMVDLSSVASSALLRRMRSNARFTVARSMCDVVAVGACGSGGPPSERAAPAGAGANAAPVAAGTATAAGRALPAAAGGTVLPLVLLVALGLVLGAALVVSFDALAALGLALAASASLAGMASAAAMASAMHRLIRSLVIDVPCPFVCRETESRRLPRL